MLGFAALALPCLGRLRFVSVYLSVGLCDYLCVSMGWELYICGPPCPGRSSLLYRHFVSHCYMYLLPLCLACSSSPQLVVKKCSLTSLLMLLLLSFLCCPLAVNSLRLQRSGPCQHHFAPYEIEGVGRIFHDPVFLQCGQVEASLTSHLTPLIPSSLHSFRPSFHVFLSVNEETQTYSSLG